MRNVVITLILFGSLAGWSWPAPAQEASEALVLTLKDSIELALKQNPFYLGTLEKEGQAKALVREASSHFFPRLNAEGTNTLAEKVFVLEFPSFIPGEPPQSMKIDFTRDYQMSLSFSLPLFTGGRLRSGHRQANFNLKATQENIRLTRLETVFNVKQAFYGNLLAEEFVEVAEEALTLAENHMKNVQNLFEVGMASKLDLLSAEVQVANLKPQLIRARNSLDVATLNLKTLLGISLERPIRIEGDLAYVPLEVEMEGILEEALVMRPELKQIDYQRRMAGEMLKIARASYFPSLAVGGVFNFWADRFSFGRGTWQNFYSINLALTVPLFNGFETRAKIGQSKAAIREIDWTRKGMSDLIKFEVRQAVLNYQQARESLLSQEKNVEQAREVVRIAELNFSEGLATSVDVSTARVALTRARTNHSQALYDCVISLAQLEKAVGRGYKENGSD